MYFIDVCKLKKVIKNVTTKLADILGIYIQKLKIFIKQELLMKGHHSRYHSTKSHYADGNNFHIIVLKKHYGD